MHREMSIMTGSSPFQLQITHSYFLIPKKHPSTGFVMAEILKLCIAKRAVLPVHGDSGLTQEFSMTRINGGMAPWAGISHPHSMHGVLTQKSLKTFLFRQAMRFLRMDSK